MKLIVTGLIAIALFGCQKTVSETEVNNTEPKDRNVCTDYLTSAEESRSNKEAVAEFLDQKIAGLKSGALQDPNCDELKAKLAFLSERKKALRSN